MSGSGAKSALKAQIWAAAFRSALKQEHGFGWSIREKAGKMQLTRRFDDGPLLRTPAMEWVGWSVTLVGALPPSPGQAIPIFDSAATELAQLRGSGTAGELIPELVRQLLQALIEGAAALGADRHQRTAERRGHRTGSRERLLATPAGDVQLRIPRFRTGSFFPSLLEPRRRVDRALWAVVMEAYVCGVSTRKVDELVVALGCESGISKTKVRRICHGLDTEVQLLKSLKALQKALSKA